MLTELHLVRHARPDAGGDVAALVAAGVLPASARWFSSPEPAAMQTARLLTTEAVTVYDALGEVTRPAGAVDDLEDCVRRGFAEPDRPSPDWETCAAAGQRIGRGVRKLLAAYPDERLVVVGHGIALTLLVAELTGTPPDADAWAGMTYPDHCVLDGPDASRLDRGWSSWR
ncbi:MAG: hypothetical protein GEV07_23370 [Streptosporangiales bacterium]|nr:hypothetical protein [Streptosporangiales bacterium]